MILYLIKHYLRYLKKSWRHRDIVDIRKQHDALLSFLPYARHVHVHDVMRPGGLWRYFTPDNIAYETYIIHFHGGGLCMGSVDSHSAMASHLAYHTQSVVILPAYRLAPEHPYPASFDDALSIYDYLTITMNIPSKNIILSDDSAGALLAFSIVAQLRLLTRPMPAMMLFFAPLTSCELLNNDSLYSDLTLRDPFLDIHLMRRLKEYVFHDMPGDNAIISPLYADYTHCPPFFSVIGSDDLLLEPLRATHIKALKAGIDCTLLIQNHCFHGHYMAPQYIRLAQEAYKAAALFMHQHIIR